MSLTGNAPPTVHRVHRRLPARVALVGIALSVPLAAAGCSSSNSSATTTTTAATTTTTVSAALKAKVRALQISLAELGCYKGQLDGIQGPATAQAIRNFQSATGLTVDGIYGAATASQAITDVRAGKRICPSSSTTTTSTTGSSSTTTTRPSGSSTTTTTSAPSTTTTTTTTTLPA